MGLQRALAAHSERQYQSDGSDDYHATQDRSAVNVDAATSAAAASLLGAFATPGAAAHTPVADRTPWSQRAASYPPWSQRSAGSPRLRAATLPPWSQRSERTASPQFHGMLKDGHRAHCEEEEQQEDEQEEGEEEDDEEDDNVYGDSLSQLSSRSAQLNPAISTTHGRCATLHVWKHARMCAV